MKLVQPEPGVFSLLDGHTQQEFRLEADGDAFLLTVQGRTVRLEVPDPRAWSSSATNRAASGQARVLSPMPGKVVRVLVAAGESVTAGQGLVVVEAMKMQNELKSPIDGIVARLDAAEGASVNANQLLVLVEAHAA